MADERVGILIELEDPDRALETLKEIDRTIRSFGRKKATIKLDDGSLVTVDERIKEIQDKLAAIKAGKGNKILDHGTVKTAKELRGELTLLQRGLKNATAEAKTFKQVFNSISSSVAHVGSAMQSMGNALTRLTSPFRRLTTGLVMGAGYKALNLFTQGFSGSFERADIMSTYDKALKALDLDVDQKFSIAGKEAKKARDNLDDAVQGLPTGLDEIMKAQKVYAGATNDMVESTKTAIAANNAFLASGMGSREQRFMQKYLVAMSSGAELATTQWESMFRIAPLVMRKVSEELGYASDQYDQFRDDVEHGTIAGKDFLKAFQKVGTEGAVAKAARVQAMTWSGLASNITIATKRMGQNILETLNDVFKQETGRSLLATLLGWDDEGADLEDGIKHWINKLSEDVQGWIRDNSKDVVGFFEKLKQLDIKGFLKGVAEGIGDVYRWGKKIVGVFSSIFGDIDAGKFGKRMVQLNALGSLLTIGGGVLKGLRHPIAGAGAFGWLFGSKLKKGGLFGRLAGVFGSKKAIQTAGETAKTVPTVGETFKGAFSALKGVITAAGAVVLVTGAGFIAFKSIKSIIKDLKEIGEELKTFEAIDGYAATGIIAGIGVFTEIFNAIGTALGPKGLLAVAIASAASFLVTGTIAADLWNIKQGVIQIKETILELDEVANAITNMHGIGTLSASTKNKFEMTIKAINDIVGMFNGKNGSVKDQGEVVAGLPTFSFGKVGALNNINNALDKMSDIAAKINKIADLTVKDPTEVIGNIKDACNQLQGVRAPKNIAQHTEAAAEALKNLNTMARRINKASNTTVNAEKFGEFVTALKDALAELKAVEGDLILDISVKLAPTFQESVKNCKTAITDAKKDIEKLKKPMYFTIPVHVKFEVWTNASQAISDIVTDVSKIVESIPNNVSTEKKLPKSITPAMGGLIYRAGGGSIFKRRGTDTVPAMLTPGEYVHNKRAVSAFGIDFMRKVNNLDMRGAMNELMHRAGNMANVNRGTHIINNYNNNQRVVINNSNAGAGFTFKTASRFVGAF